MPPRRSRRAGAPRSGPARAPAPRSARRPDGRATDGPRCATRAPRAASSRAERRCALHGLGPACARRGWRGGRPRTGPSPRPPPARTCACTGTRAVATEASRARGSRGAGGAAPAPRRSPPAAALACMRPAERTGQVGAHAVVTPEEHTSLVGDRRVAGLPASCSSAPKRSACPRVSSSAERLRQLPRDALTRSPSTAAGSRSISTTRSSTSSVCPHTSRWWYGFCSTPFSAVQLRQQHVPRAQSVHQPDPAAGSSARDQPAQLVERALRRDRLDAARQRAGRARSCRGFDLEAQLAGEPRHPQHAQRVVLEGMLGHGAQQCASARSALPAVRVDQRSPIASSGRGHGVDREVAQREVCLDRLAAQRREVGLPRAIPRDHAPRAESLRQREQMRVDRRRRSACGPLGVASDDDVTSSSSRPVEQRIAHRPADQPCPLARQRRARERTAAERSRRATGSLKTWRAAHARHARGDPARHLVVDRAEHARKLLGA